MNKKPIVIWDTDDSKTIKRIRRNAGKGKSVKVFDFVRTDAERMVESIMRLQLRNMPAIVVLTNLHYLLSNQKLQINILLNLLNNREFYNYYSNQMEKVSDNISFVVLASRNLDRHLLKSLDNFKNEKGGLKI